MAGIELQHGSWRARLLPEAGGLIATLDHGGVPVLRPMAGDGGGPLDAACFPMVPWCNRIAGARFGWEGAGVALTPNFPPERHAIHGHGWQAQWAIEAQDQSSCMMVHRHDGQTPGTWPWAYEAWQAVVLDDDGCRITLALTNCSDRSMPAGLGLHPYLRRRAGSRVTFGAAAIVAVDADMIPSGESLPPAHFADFAQGAGLPDTLIDHCYTGWNGAAQVADACGTITLSAEGASALHLYAPGDAAILCLEPVNHTPDAANTGTMPLAAPGETVRLTLRIGVS